MDKTEPQTSSVTGVIASATWAEDNLLYVNVSVLNRDVKSDKRICSSLVRCRFRMHKSHLQEVWDNVKFGSYVTITGTPSVNGYLSATLDAKTICVHSTLELKEGE
jgi:hypothetical protein